MKRLIIRTAVLICIVGVFAAITGCTEKNQDPQESNKSVQQILENLSVSREKLDSSLYFNDSIFEENCEKLYSVKYSELTDGGILYCESGEYADKISILKLTNSSSANAEKILENRKQARIKVYEGYSPSETEKANNAAIFEENGYAVLIIADDTASLEKAVRKELD